MEWRTISVRLRPFSQLLLVVVTVAAFLPGCSAAAIRAPRAAPAGAWQALPLVFEANRGQADPEVKYLARMAAYSLYLADSEMLLALPQAGRVIRLRFLGASPAARAEGVDPLPGRSHYFLGQHPGGWLTSIPHFGRVRQHSLYPGVEAVYYGNPRQMEFDLVLAAGVSPGLIRLGVEGASDVRLDQEGNVILTAGGHEVRLLKPRAYQEAGGRRKPVVGRYVLRGQRQVGFEITAYDRGRPLVIDPALNYSTYLGAASDEVAYAVAVDGAGNAFLAGYTASTGFPVTSGAYRTAHQGGVYDAFVAKLNSTGTAFEYVTYLGGSGDDIAYGIALDSSGNAYVTGSTTSTNFPVTPGAYRGFYGGGLSDAFVTKLNPSGMALLYSTFLGGSGEDVAYGISLDGLTNATLTGATASADFPVTAGAYRTAYGGGLSDAFVTRLNASGTALVFSTFLGGSLDDVGYGVAVDAMGNSYVTGYTQSANFPVTAGAVQGTKSGGYDAFVTALNSSATAAVYSTFLGGASEDYGVGIAVSSGGTAYVVGYTASANFPVTSGAAQGTKASGYDAFVTKLSPSGTAPLSYSTFLGGNGDDYGLALAVDAAGNAYVTGDSASTDFPITADAIQTALTGMHNAFLTKLNPTGTSRLYSSLVGGSGFETGYGVAVDAAGRAYVTGYSVSADFPTTAGAAQRTYGGAAEAFLLRTVPLNVTPSVGAVSPGAGSGLSQTFTFTFSDPNGWENLGVVNILINNFLDGRYACYLAYARPINVLYLVNDPGTALLPGLVLNGTGSVGNSQCTIYGSASSASGSGDTLTLILNLSFKPAYAGTKIIYVAARDGAGHNSGWRPMGVWIVPGAPATSPAVVGMMPQSGSGAGPATFTFHFSDSNGWQNPGVLNILINDYLDGRHACYLAYSRPLGVLYLVNDPGNALLPELYLSTNTSVSNSQCTVYGAGSSAVASGNTLTLTLAISFNSSFVGDRIIYMAARDVAERNWGWQAMGRWRVP